MFIVPEEDIVIFARGLLGRHGPAARSLAQERAMQFSALGDNEGMHAWTRVVDAVQQLSPDDGRWADQKATAA